VPVRDLASARVAAGEASCWCRAPTQKRHALSTVETVGVEPTTSSLQARRSATRASSPGGKVRTGGVEPPQREAAGLQPVELAGAQRPRELGWPNGLEPIPSGLTTPDAALHHGHHEAGTGTTGLEPAPSRLTNERSAQLSYAPKIARVGFEPTVSSS
jgi:hypothetical protein